MEFKELQYIVTIAECEGITKAAEKLYIAQSSLSQFLKNYEEKLGCKIFARSTHGLKVTYEGERIIATAKQIIAITRSLNNELADISKLKVGRVIFGISTYRAPYLLPLVMPTYNEKYPNIRVEFVEASMAEQEENVINGAVDVAILSPPLNNKSLSYETFMNEELFLVAQKGHSIEKIAHYNPVTKRKWIDLKEIENNVFIVHNKHHRLRSFAEQVFEDYKITPKIIEYNTNIETVIRLIITGMGIGFIPETYISYHSHLDYYSIGESGRYRELAFSYSTTGYVSKATKAFVEVVKETLEKGKSFTDILEDTSV